MKNDSPLNIYELIMNNTNLSKEEKIEALEKLKSYTDKKYDDSLRNTLTKKWTGSALEIGSAGIPLGGAGKLGSTLGGSLLKSTLGRKLSQEVGSGAVSGLLSGTVFGAGQGLIDNENLLKTAAEYGASGLLLGAITGGSAGYIEKAIKGNKLSNYNVGNMFGAEYKNYKNQAKNYYKDYLQDKVINNKDIGKITFTRKGMDEIFSKNPELGTLFPKLVNDVKDANYLETNPLYKIRKDKATKEFHTLKSPSYKHIIAEDKLGNKKFYLTKKDTINQGTPSRAEGTSFDSILGTNPAYLDESRALKLEPNTIIAENAASFNPSSTFLPAWLSSALFKQTSSSPSLEEPNIESNRYLLKGGIEINVPNYSDYINPVTGSSKVYSREDIANMSGEEYSKNEAEIFGQIKSIGIPAAKDLESSTLRGDTVYVNSYTRDDGTEVKGYYRARPSRI